MALKRCANWKDARCPYSAEMGWADEGHLVEITEDGVTSTLCLECYMVTGSQPAAVGGRTVAGLGICDGHCGSPADGHSHLPMWDPPGTTRLEVIKAKLASMHGST